MGFCPKCGRPVATEMRVPYEQRTKSVLCACGHTIVYKEAGYDDWVKSEKRKELVKNTIVDEPSSLYLRFTNILFGVSIASVAFVSFCTGFTPPVNSFMNTLFLALLMTAVLGGFLLIPWFLSQTKIIHLGFVSNYDRAIVYGKRAIGILIIGSRNNWLYCRGL